MLILQLLKIYQRCCMKITLMQRKTDGRVYNLPTVSEVAALIVGDVGDAEERDIIIQAQGGQLLRIDEFHGSYLPLRSQLNTTSSK